MSKYLSTDVHVLLIDIQNYILETLVYINKGHIHQQQAMYILK